MKHFIENHADQRLGRPPVRGRGLKLGKAVAVPLIRCRPPCGGVD